MSYDRELITVDRTGFFRAIEELREAALCSPMALGSIRCLIADAIEILEGSVSPDLKNTKEPR